MSAARATPQLEPHWFENSFAAESLHPWFRRDKHTWLFIAVTAVEISLFLAGIRFISFIENRDIDALAIQMDLGDLPAKLRNTSSSVEVDEVFGNEYVKDKTPVDPNAEDPRASSAPNLYAAGASLPVDLNPEILPEFPAEARAAGVTGVVTLEIVVSDEGRVLRARPVGRLLGHGLEGAAQAAYRKKTFQPSLKDGKAITVKFYQPVRFVLTN